MRCAGASHSHSQRRLELQIVQPVDRFDVDTLLLAAVPDIERNRGTGGTRGPQPALKNRPTHPKLAISAGSRTCTSADLPNASGFRLSGCIARSTPKPVS